MCELGSPEGAEPGLLAHLADVFVAQGHGLTPGGTAAKPRSSDPWGGVGYPVNRVVPGGGWEW